MIEFIINHWISIAGTIMGLLYLYLEYKANIWMWLASIIMAVFFIVIYYDTKLYASMMIYSYFLLASVYGWYKWQQNRKKNNSSEDIIIQVSKKITIPLIISILIVWGIVYYILIRFTENQCFISLGDALTTTLNIIALWMAARHYAEQWLLLIPANAISAILLIIQNDSISAILFVVYFIVSIMGYFKWKKLAIEKIRS